MTGAATPPPLPPAGSLFPVAGDEHGAFGVDESRALDGYCRAMRCAQNAAAQARPPADVWARAAELAQALEDLLSPYAVPERQRIVGQVREFPGRGQTLVPAIQVLYRDADEVRAEVVLDESHLGANAAAHGGVLPLILDELLGQQANVARTRARTAYLRVDYRRITPLSVPLSFRARVTREEGRKRFLEAAVHAGGELIVEAEGLFVELRPGQP